MANNTITINGEHTDATIMTTELDENAIEQVRRMTNHEAFQNPIVVQPDAHYGAGAVIGFTMAVGTRLCPNTVGVDVGCGMEAANLGTLDHIDFDDTSQLADIDSEIRNRIPFGFETHDRLDYHFGETFPWDECQRKLDVFNANSAFGTIGANYGLDYFKDVMARTGYDLTRAINSFGTLGGGNHFIEVAKSEQTGEYWCVIHSGSRGPGAAIAQHWQERATYYRDDRAETVRDRLSEFDPRYYVFDLDTVSDDDLLDWLQGGMGEDWKNMDAIVADYRETNPERIEEVKNRLTDIGKYVTNNGDGDPLDYLEGSEARGYIRDMIFAQTYAIQSRKHMMRTVADVFEANITDSISSIHNYVDFEDQVIRKGAIRLHEGERAIIPFNMAVGSLVVEGKGAEEWNRSGPHGAGRVMSRRRAHDELSMDDFKASMDGVFSTSVTEETLDEAPQSYKAPAVIESVLDEAATVVDRLTPVMNLKAE